MAKQHDHMHDKDVTIRSKKEKEAKKYKNIQQPVFAGGHPPNY